MSLIPEAGLRSVSIAGAIMDCFFGLFSGANISNPVNVHRNKYLNQPTHPCYIIHGYHSLVDGGLCIFNLYDCFMVILFLACSASDSCLLFFALSIMNM